MSLTPTIERLPTSVTDAPRQPPSGEAPVANPLDVVFRIPGACRLAGRLGRAELRRRLLHVLPGLFPLLLWLYPHDYPWELPLRVWVAGLAVLLAFFGLKHFRSVARHGEGAGNDSVMGYSFSVLGTLAVAPQHPEYTLMVVTILAFGDGSATLGGVLLGGPKLFWNREKTWAGLLSFWLCGSLVSAVAYWGEVVPHVPFREALLVGAIITAAAAFAESLPLRMNDNLRVGIVSLVACFAVVEQEYIPLRMLAIATTAVWLVMRLRRARRSDGVDALP